MDKLHDAAPDPIWFNAYGLLDTFNETKFDGDQKLPTINLPKFHGDVDNWMEFRETFSNLIHENDEITNIQKLHYLKASLFGEAAEIIKSLEFTSNNYIIAFNAICERYNNPRMLVHNHVKSILDLETSTKESASKLRKINDSLFKHVSALKSLATEAELLDAILIHIVSNKLDPTTFRGWESFKNTLGTHIPSLNQFKEFIKNSANLLESLESKQPKPYLDKGKTCSKSFVSSGPICALCKQSHYLSKCDRFHKLTPPDRLAKAKELKQRTKWRSHHSDLKPGTLVLLKDDNQPTLHWKLGRIVSIHPGNDGYARAGGMFAPILIQNAFVTWFRLYFVNPSDGQKFHLDALIPDFLSNFQTSKILEETLREAIYAEVPIIPDA
ncbi:hypothetical protein HUJ04_011994 [Dendroctonus ponderosae]|nr:hypothetical protein HUJ04_011994 [Dendroctonus ponderosae]